MNRFEVNRRVRRAMAACLLITILLAGCSDVEKASEQNQQGKVIADKFFEAMKSGEFDEATQYYSARTKSKKAIQIIREEWNNMKKNRGQLTGWSRYRFFMKHGEFTGQSYRLNFTGGDAYVEVQLINENGNWVIDGVIYNYDPPTVLNGTTAK